MRGCMLFHKWKPWHHDAHYIKAFDAVVRVCARCRTQERWTAVDGEYRNKPRPKGAPPHD